MQKRRLWVLLVAVIATIALSLAQAPKKKGTATGSKTHLVVNEGDIKWGTMPASWVQGTPPPEFAGPPNIQVAVVQGDPVKSGVPYVVRFKVPDGEKIAPHWHPMDEQITVLQGTFVLGMGDKFDQTAGEELSAGAYGMVAKKMMHFGWTKGDTILQVHGTGPFKIVFVNPAAKTPAKPAKKTAGK